MRSWTPRRPSASIKRRLFPQAPADENHLLNPIAWRWLAPAMTLCIGALIVLLRSPHAGFGQPNVPPLTPTFALSNLSFSTYYADAGQNERNILQATFFEWTNGAHSTTTPPSVFDRTRY